MQKLYFVSNSYIDIIFIWKSTSYKKHPYLLHKNNNGFIISFLFYYNG